MAKENEKLQAVLGKLEAISNSARVMGSEGLVEDIKIVIEQIKKDL